MHKLVALLNAVIFFLFWLVVLYAGADHPPPPGFVAVVLLDLAAAALVYWRVPVYWTWFAMHGSRALPLVVRDGLVAGLLFAAVAMAGSWLLGGGEPTVTATGSTKPAYVAALEAAYGAPSQAGFGSAVFYEQLKATGDLDQAALAKYRFFVGDLWDRYGEAAWMGPWKKVFTRQAGVQPDIVAELRSLDDRQARLSAAMVLDEVEDAENARTALAAAFDDPAVSELAVYAVGDGAAMSGILIAGHRGTSGEATFLVFLLD